MTNKDDDDIEKELREILVPWDWEDVVLPDFKEEYFDWCQRQGLIFNKTFYLHIDEPDAPTGDWPFVRQVVKHHYLFKDPAIATAFSLTFLT